MAKQTSQKTYLTQEGFDKLKKELHHLRTAERARIADAIAEARAHGDISENAEYDAAKEAQGHLEARISKLETTISNARVVDESQIDDSKAFILSTVKVKNLNTDAEQSFTLVSQEEADLAQQKISIKSPIGKGLLGKEIGDVVEIDVPAGTVKLKILDISR
ncbi:MAG: transcription elongation factor GreA [Bacteroidetes bacterium]|jgi:transcription elongation factor GreA|nr:transcription elongation factor GreA [Bacteroidota bacterium]